MGDYGGSGDFMAQLSSSIQSPRGIGSLALLDAAISHRNTCRFTEITNDKRQLVFPFIQAREAHIRFRLLEERPATPSLALLEHIPALDGELKTGRRLLNFSAATRTDLQPKPAFLT